jgi:protein ImuB
VAAVTSPRLEPVAPDRVHLDLAGLDALFGAEPRLADRLADGAASLDLPARVGIAGSRTVAGLATRAKCAPPDVAGLGPRRPGRADPKRDGVTVVPPGQESAFLAPLPVGLLDPSPELAECLDRWGIRTLGALAALPGPAILARLGVPGMRLRARARGEDDGPFTPRVAPERWLEAVALDWEVALFEGLIFILHRLLERLTARLALRELGATALTLTAGLADGTAHCHRLGLLAPLGEPRTLLGLLRAELDGLTLPAPIVSLAVEAEAAPLRPAQPDLFAPKRPSPHELAQTLGRLTALVGADRIGAPTIGDSHRPTAVGRASFTGPVGRQAAVAALTFAEAGTLACRRYVPPIGATVSLRDAAPCWIEAGGLRGAVVACAGPWRTAGEWWADTAWSREEWDVALADGVVYRLVLDRASGAWTVDAVYD